MENLTNISLNDAQQNTIYTIVGCSLQDPQKLRFAELGFTKGNKVKVVGTAPLGCPMQVEVLNTVVCIRKADAERIMIELTVDS